MKAEVWQQVREILDHAIALPANERCSYLEQACNGNSELRGEVESLLRSHEDAGSIFLKDPALDLKSAIAAAPAQSRIGRHIGAYEIVEEIGHGGMGEVYRAVRADGQYDKQVAIKLVRVGLDTPALVERFRHERQILATLDHPNIARLIDGGATEEGVPYLVMELIEGRPIDEYCAEHYLEIKERLELFLQVCASVQYAHQRLVIHRDIKPSNILVTAQRVPKLLDFGIAKILDPAGVSETTLLRPMTPEYASPEQIRGETITTASDVYSLGVVLYKLLTGRSPYPEKTRSALEFAKAVCEAEPARPSTVIRPKSLPHEFAGRPNGSNVEKSGRTLKGDLDNIAVKALRKEPARRYASVEQFADDIRKHLEGLPVTATPDSTSYRIRKFVRRHTAAVAAAALIVLAVTGGVAATLWEARVAVRERARAERRFNDVRKLANSFLFEFDAAIKDLPGSTPARSLVVQRALEYLDGLAAEARGDRSLQMEIASAYQRVGEVQGDPMFPNLGDSKGALQSSNKALVILETVAREELQNPQVGLGLASIHQQISDVLHFSGDTAGAVEHSGKALKVYEDLAVNMASNVKFQTERVIQTYQYANLLNLAGRLDEAAIEYTKAVELSQQMIAANRSDQEGKFHLATSLDGLGNVLQEKGDTAQALENRRQGLAIREELAKHNPNNAHYRRQLAFSHHNVGLSLVEAGDLATALANFRQELSLFESLSASDPKDVQGRRNQSLARKQIGDVLMRTGDFRGALAQYRASLDIDHDLVSADPANSQAVLDLSFSESKVGSALGKLGQTREALVILRSGVARQEFLIAKDPHHILLYNHLANSYTRLANCLLDSGNAKGATEYYRKAVDARIMFAGKSPNSSTNQGALAECYANLAKVLAPSDSDDALKEYSNAIELLESLAANNRTNVQHRIDLADAFLNAARVHVHMAGAEDDTSIRLKDWTTARDFYQRSQKMWLELSVSGKLPPARGRIIQEVSGELAHCNDSLAKLQSVR
jgi:eukaryotic-like serine/threonine-protein kinase